MSLQIPQARQVLYCQKLEYKEKAWESVPIARPAIKGLRIAHLC